MRRFFLAVGAFVVLTGGPLTGPGEAPLLDFFASALAQPDPVNNTSVGPETATDLVYGQAVEIHIEQAVGYVRIRERELASFPVTFRDVSIEGGQVTAASIPLSCTILNRTAPASNWVSNPEVIPSLARHGQVDVTFQIIAGNRPSPPVFTSTVECRAGHPVNDVIGVFSITAQVEEYVYMAVVPKPAPATVRPNGLIMLGLDISNTGSHVKRYAASVEAPPGWDIPTPPSVILQPGEIRTVSFPAIAPRDKILYLYEGQTLRVDYAPVGDAGRGQPAIYNLSVHGVYVHPALLPLAILAILIVSLLVFLFLLARRAIEEQILGKPIPPWRIPVERAYLDRLLKEDPEQHYIVRYYLMVEEHESALLWFYAFKKATKKDRKRERAWVSVKRQREREIGQLERKHKRLESSWDKEFEKRISKDEREVNVLERKLRRRERKVYRKAARRHGKKVARLERRHRKAQAKAAKRHGKKELKANRTIDRENRKRAKRGEELLPSIREPVPEVPPPALPAGPSMVEVPLHESRFGKRADRLKARQERRLDRMETKRDAQLERHRRATDAKIARVRARIPPEPTTHLYESIEYVPENEVIVEDDRPWWARRLGIPTLEEREAERRRDTIHQVRLQEAKAAGDTARVAELEAAWVADQRSARQERRNQASSSRVHANVRRRLAAERRRSGARVPPSSTARPSEDDAAADGPADQAMTQPGERRGFRALRRRKDRGQHAEETDSTPAGQSKQGIEKPRPPS